MAKTKKKATPAQKEEVGKKDDDRVVKRPARGFHRFRSGILNVTPKGGEKELVKNNQDSPLLRLPPELRDRIWGFAIGAHVLRVVYTNSPANKTVVKIQPPFKENRNTLALLRTCRQIYSETALLPYKSSTYSCDLWQPLSHGLRHIKRFQRAQIEDLQVELDLPWSRNPVRIQELCVDKLAILPGLKRVRILAFRDKYVLEHELEESRETIRNSLEPILAGTNISTMFEVAEMGSYEYTKK